MAMTRDEMSELAEYFADAISRRGIGRDRAENSFFNFSARKSSVGEQNSSKSSISDLDNIVGSDAKKIMREWGDAVRDETRILKGSALRDAHDFYIENLKDIAEKSKEVNKEIVDSYSKIIEANKGNHAVQQDVHDSLARYTESLEKLSDMTDNENQSAPSRKKIREVNDALAKEAKLLKNMGITVEKTSIAYNRSTKRYTITDPQSANATITTNKKILSASDAYVKDLTSMHKQEIHARTRFIASLAGVLAKGIFDVGKRIFGTVESRLQNLQSETDFTGAALNNMLPQEMNDWMNANRKTKALLGESSDLFYDKTTDTLNTFGYFGASLKAIQTTLANNLMSAGINPTSRTANGASATDALMESVAAIQEMDGVTREEAIRMAGEALKSPYYYLQAFGKSDAEQLKVLKSQLYESKVISKEIGLSNEFLEDQKQQILNNRYQDIIGKITKRAYTESFISSVEDVRGKKFTDEEKTLIYKNTVGTPTDPEIAKYNTGVGKEIAEMFIKFSDQSSKDSVTGDFNKSLAGIPLDILADKMGLDRVGLMKAFTESGVKKETEGAAITNLFGEDNAKFLASLDASKKSLTEIEKTVVTISNIVDGLGKSPVGGVLGDVANLVISAYGVKGLFKLATKVLPTQAVRVATAARNVLPKVTTAARTAYEVVKNKLPTNILKTVKETPNIRSTPELLRNDLKSAAKGGLFLAAAVGVVEGIYKGFNTDSYANKYGAEDPTSLPGELAVRTAGVLSDVLMSYGDAVLQGVTLGTVSTDSINNWIGPDVTDAIGGTINSILKLFGGGIDDSVHKAYNEELKAMEETRAIMASGNTIEKTPDNQTSINETLKLIEQHTRNTAVNVEDGNKKYEELQEKKLTESKYALQVRANAENMLNQRSESFTKDRNMALTSAYGNIDSAFGAAP